MARTNITDEMVAEFVRLNQRDQSYRSIGDQFGVDWRTVKARIQKAKEEGDQQHWEAVSRQVDCKFLEEHYAMLRQMALAILKPVTSQPLFNSQDQKAEDFFDAFANSVVRQSTSPLIKSRGIDLSPAALTGLPDSLGDLPLERFPLMLRESLFEHEPGLRRLVEQWKECWDRFQRARKKLAGEAIGLIKQSKHPDPELLESSPALAHEAMVRALLNMTGDYPVVEPGEAGKEAVQFRPGSPGDNSISIISDGEVSGMEAFEYVQQRILDDDRMALVSEPYQQLVEVVREIENYVARIMLKGRPEGRCASLCPEALLPST